MANLQIIKMLCRHKRFTIRELAKRVGKDESTIQSMIRNGSTSTRTLEDIANVLEVSPAIFFDGYTEPVKLETLKKEIEVLQERLKDKERLISVLMENRK